MTSVAKVDYRGAAAPKNIPFSSTTHRMIYLLWEYKNNKFRSTRTRWPSWSAETSPKPCSSSTTFSRSIWNRVELSIKISAGSLQILYKFHAFCYHYLWNKLWALNPDLSLVDSKPDLDPSLGKYMYVLT